MICKYFLQFCGLPFYFVDSFSWWTKIFNFCKVQFSVFSFGGFVFGVMSKKSLPNSVSWSICLTFSKSFIILGLTFKSLILFELRVQLHSFACEHPVFPAPLVEETDLPHWNVLVTLLKILWPHTKGFISGLYSIPLIYKSAFMPISQYFDDCSFVMGLKNFFSGFIEI